MEKLNQLLESDLKLYFKIIKNAIYRSAILGEEPKEYTMFENKIISLFTIPFTRALTDNILAISDIKPIGYIKCKRKKLIYEAFI